MASTLKRRLDRLYATYDFKSRRAFDPIDLVHRYTKPEDIEAAGLIVAALSYGKVELFMRVAGRLLDHMGSSPADYVRSFRVRRRRFPGISYRFARNNDLQAFLFAVSDRVARFGSIKSLFSSGISEKDSEIGGGISGAVRELRGVDLSPIYGRRVVPPGFLHLLPTPESGGAAKRMALFMRWMVRDRDLDFGIWKEVGANRLVIPLDTHIARISRCLGLTRRLSSDWKTALDITSNLKRMDPDDPLKYDFVLCHTGISGQCPTRRNLDTCRNCQLRQDR